MSKYTKSDITLDIPIDHVGIVGRQIDGMIAAFKKLGFYSLGATSLDIGESDGRPPSQNTHFVFERGYIELIASQGEDHLASYVARHEGLNIMAMASEDAEASRRALEQLELKPGDVYLSSRHAAHGEKVGTAKFNWFGFDAASFPEGLVCVTEHLTPELIYQPKRLEQPNGAVALSEIFMLVDNADDVDAAVARYSQLSYDNCVVERVNGDDENGEGSRNSGGSGQTWFNKLTIVDRAGAERRFPQLETPVKNGFLGLAIEVESVVKVKELLATAEVPFQADESGGVWVQPEHAVGSVIVFHE